MLPKVNDTVLVNGKSITKRGMVVGIERGGSINSKVKLVYTHTHQAGYPVVQVTSGDVWAVKSIGNRKWVTVV